MFWFFNRRTAKVFMFFTHCIKYHVTYTFLKLINMIEENPVSPGMILLVAMMQTIVYIKVKVSFFCFTCSAHALSTFLCLIVFVDFINWKSDKFAVSRPLWKNRMYPAVFHCSAEFAMRVFQVFINNLMASQNVSLYESESPQPNKATYL